MTDRLVVDLDARGRVTVSVQRGEPELPEDLPEFAGEPFELAWPLDGEQLDGLRWYLEDYLHAPYGANSARGERIAAALKPWGEAVFRSVFGAGPARDAYVRAHRGDAALEVVFRSSSAQLLGLPWELMRDPERPSPLALDRGGLSRSLPAAALAESFAVEGDVLRVLMIISRPAGTRDVGYRMVARPLLERLEAVRGRVELVVLRPPTLDALARTLAEARDAGRPFQIVHFDGHGVLPGRRTAHGGGSGPLSLDAPAGEVLLVFEGPEGGADRVGAATVAQVLSEARIPVVVLNGCQSGAVGKELEAAVATRLLQEGVSSVVAMAYSVYAVAAAEFMAAFYERLFAGDRVTDAVGAGRRRLSQRPERPSPKGEMALADWVIPVHYRRRDIHFPTLATPRSVPRPLDAMLDDIREQARDAGDGAGLDPVGAFIGRDGLFYELEVACRAQRAVVLHGPGGTGKTELAKAFGRWSRDTAGAQRVIFHSFEPGVASFGLDGVLAAIGLQAFGAQFARLDPDEREAVILSAVREHQLLVIWDNFESVMSMPDPTGATPPLEQDERARLARFVTAIAAGGRSALLITSRTPEDWLSDDVARLPVGGLNRDEAVQYGDVLLSGIPTSRARRARPAFGELLDALDGHPLSMRLVLPHVASTDPEELLDALRGRRELPTGRETGRLASLESCVGYSFEHLDAGTRRVLTAVSMFHGIVDTNVLTMLSTVQGAPERFAGVDRTGWGCALQSATRVGLLTSMGGGLYRIHPALPAYLRAVWQRDERDRYDEQHTSTTQALLTAYSAFSEWLFKQIHTGDSRLALRLVELNRRTLGYLLGSALSDKRWELAQAIAQLLNEYFDSRGLHEEARAWVHRGRQATENTDGTAPEAGTPGEALWRFLVASEANRELQQGRLASAQRTYREMVEALNCQTSSTPRQRHLAVCYHQLGIVEQQQMRLDDAENSYSQSLAISKELSDRAGMARSYQNLGMVGQMRGDLDHAEGYYLQSLALKEQLGDRAGMARSHQNLGMVAQLRGNLNHAEDCYLQSLAIRGELGDRPGIADSYHQLGIVAQRRARPDDAEDWYLKSLSIREELGRRPDMARSYHNLGMVARLRGRLRDAELWYCQSLSIREELGDRPGMAVSYGELGLLAESQERPAEALEWMVKCVALFDAFPHPGTGTGPCHLARLTATLGLDALEASWLAVTGGSLPAAVRGHIASENASDDRQ